jgi:hypothetical protein
MNKSTKKSLSSLSVLLKEMHNGIAPARIYSWQKRRKAANTEIYCPRDRFLCIPILTR